MMVIPPAEASALGRGIVIGNILDLDDMANVGRCQSELLLHLCHGIIVLAVDEVEAEDCIQRLLGIIGHAIFTFGRDMAAIGLGSQSLQRCII